MAKDGNEGFIPALRFHWLTPLYDLIVKITCRETTFKSKLVELAEFNPNDVVLDVGCGSGTLSSMAKTAMPSISLTGIDADEKILTQARNKARKRGLHIDFLHAFSQQIPLSELTFSVTVSSLFFHHLHREEKKETLLEMNRLLRKSGRLVIADWGKPTNLAMHLAFLVVRLFDGMSSTSDNARGNMPGLIAEAGFTEVQERASFMTLFGSMKIWTAVKSGNESKGQ